MLIHYNLKDKVDFYAPTYTKNKYGTTEATYNYAFSVWGDFVHRSNTLIDRNSSEISVVYKDFYVRYTPDIVRNMKLVDEHSQQYEIIDIAEVDRKKRLKLVCKMVG